MESKIYGELRNLIVIVLSVSLLSFLGLNVIAYVFLFLAIFFLFGAWQIYNDQAGMNLATFVLIITAIVFFLVFYAIKFLQIPSH
jgi:hypothetical protein